MSENWAIALVIFILGQFIACASAIVVGGLWLANRINIAEKETEHRLTELETQAEKWFILTGSQALHRDDDRFGCDGEIEAFVIKYKKGMHDMPSAEWIAGRNLFLRICNNPLATPNEKMLALGLVELCEHKMERDGLLVENPRPLLAHE